jgi:uncharacterized protein
MTKPVIAIDFDDVVFNFNGHFIPWHNEHHGSDVTYEGTYTFSMTDVYGVDADTLLERVRTFAHTQHHTVLPIPGAVSALKRLMTQYELHIVTSRSETLHDTTSEWLAHHVPGVFHHLHFTNGFGGLSHHEKRSKSDVCTDINARVHIDDAYMHAEEVAINAGIPTILPDRPWNRNDMLHPNVVRLHSWPEIVQHIETHVR